MSFFDSLTSVPEYQAQALARENNAMAPIPQMPQAPVQGMAKGGSASSHADGIASKGKTRGKMM